MLKGRAPFDAEVDDEVLKEFKRREAEKKKSHPDHKKDIVEVRARVAELEKSITILGENVVPKAPRRDDAPNSESKWKARKLIQEQNRGIGSGGSGG